RLAQAADSAASPKSPGRADASKLLADLRAASLAADALDLNTGASVPSEVIEKYMGTERSAFELKWPSMVGDLATQAAGGAPGNPQGALDRPKIDRLMKARDLVDSLREDATVEAALAKAPLLQRWV